MIWVIGAAKDTSRISARTAETQPDPGNCIARASMRWPGCEDVRSCRRARDRMAVSTTLLDKRRLQPHSSLKLDQEML